jgi:hypothetical protein
MSRLLFLLGFPFRFTVDKLRSGSPFRICTFACVPIHVVEEQIKSCVLCFSSVFRYFFLFFFYSYIQTRHDNNAKGQGDVRGTRVSVSVPMYIQVTVIMLGKTQIKICASVLKTKESVYLICNIYLSLYTEH